MYGPSVNWEVLFFSPHPCSRETSGPWGKRNLLFPSGPYNSVYYYELVLLFQCRLATNRCTQLMIAGAVFVMSYLQTIGFIHAELIYPPLLSDSAYNTNLGYDNPRHHDAQRHPMAVN